MRRANPSDGNDPRPVGAGGFKEMTKISWVRRVEHACPRVRSDERHRRIHNVFCPSPPAQLASGHCLTVEASDLTVGERSGEPCLARSVPSPTLSHRAGWDNDRHVLGHGTSESCPHSGVTSIECHQCAGVEDDHRTGSARPESGNFTGSSDGIALRPNAISVPASSHSSWLMPPASSSTSAESASSRRRRSQWWPASATQAEKDRPSARAAASISAYSSGSRLIVGFTTGIGS